MIPVPRPGSISLSNPYPGLGRFVRNEFDNILAGVNVYRIWLEGHHQVHYRVAGGESGLWQRCVVYVRNAPPANTPLPAGNIDLILGGEFWATPTGWSAFEPHSGTYTYYWGGAYHKDGGWHWDSGVRERKDVYANGIVWTLNYDDTGDHPDYNDYTIEVACVWGGHGAPPQVEGRPSAADKVEEVSQDAFQSLVARLQGR
jgi:hypothetical protein